MDGSRKVTALQLQLQLQKFQTRLSVLKTISSPYCASLCIRVTSSASCYQREVLGRLISPPTLNTLIEISLSPSYSSHSLQLPRKNLWTISKRKSWGTPRRNSRRIPRKKKLLEISFCKKFSKKF